MASEGDSKMADVAPEAASGGQLDNTTVETPELPQLDDPSKLLLSQYGRTPLCLEFLFRAGSRPFDGQFQVSSTKRVEGSLRKRGDYKKRSCTYSGTGDALTSRCDAGMLQIETEILSAALSFAHQTGFSVKQLTGPLASPKNAQGVDGSYWYEGKVELPGKPTGVREMDITFSQDPNTHLMKQVRVSYGGRYSFQLLVQRQSFALCDAP